MAKMWKVIFYLKSKLLTAFVFNMRMIVQDHKTIRYSLKNAALTHKRKQASAESQCDRWCGKAGATEMLSSHVEVCYFDFIRIQTSAKMACGGQHVDE